MAREPQIRERLSRQGCQTYASRTSENCCKTSDRCLQGGSGGQEDQVASEPELRITTALKEHPTMNISEVRRGVNVKTLRLHQRPEWGCEGMTSGRATGC